jgi:hypothetical protein
VEAREHASAIARSHQERKRLVPLFDIRRIHC